MLANSLTYSSLGKANPGRVRSSGGVKGTKGRASMTNLRQRPNGFRRSVQLRYYRATPESEARDPPPRPEAVYSPLRADPGIAARPYRLLRPQSSMRVVA